MSEIGAYDPDTNTHYPSWEVLVEAASNGWVATAIISHNGNVWPWMEGPFATKREANNARARLRRLFNREQHERPGVTASFYVRPLWKPERSRVHG